LCCFDGNCRHTRVLHFNQRNKIRRHNYASVHPINYAMQLYRLFWQMHAHAPPLSHAAWANTRLCTKQAQNKDSKDFLVYHIPFLPITYLTGLSNSIGVCIRAWYDRDINRVKEAITDELLSDLPLKCASLYGHSLRHCCQLPTVSATPHTSAVFQLFFFFHLFGTHEWPELCWDYILLVLFLHVQT
jgi:hypothetical protein